LGPSPGDAQNEHKTAQWLPTLLHDVKTAFALPFQFRHELETENRRKPRSDPMPDRVKPAGVCRMTVENKAFTAPA
jgi:hypothetical protein